MQLKDARELLTKHDLKVDAKSVVERLSHVNHFDLALSITCKGIDYTLKTQESYDERAKAYDEAIELMLLLRFADFAVILDLAEKGEA